MRLAGFFVVVDVDAGGIGGGDAASVICLSSSSILSVAFGALKSKSASESSRSMWRRTGTRRELPVLVVLVVVVVDVDDDVEAVEPDAFCADALESTGSSGFRLR